MPTPFETAIAQSLRLRWEQHLYRSRRVIAGPQNTRLTIGNKEYLSFCSNDYLGLANHPEVIKALQKGAQQYGVGSGAAHLICGHSAAHHALEEELAEFTGRPRALLFSTGYMANLGAIAALLGEGDAVFEDRLNHASLIDAGLYSGARFYRYRHGDTQSLIELLNKCNATKKLIVTDGVFSMDGGIAPLPALASFARDHNAWLMVDDAHGLGVIGEEGRGTVDYHGLSAKDVPVLMGTLGKAFGSFGAFISGEENLIEFLIQEARTYIYTTALPPAIAEATRVSLHLAQQEQWRREKLGSLVSLFRRGAGELGLPLTDSATPIQPLIIGDNAKTLHVSQQLFDHGFLISAIRPPTVPVNSARLRITFSASHEVQDVERLLSQLEKLL
ncbi:MAG: 8-amino-7-oxononanoate synthase [Gammaproteobacteria bacterium]|nr:8-amino-7-oxononanoate synthase [Gammaproteobacteria bacterium]